MPGTNALYPAQSSPFPIGTSTFSIPVNLTCSTSAYTAGYCVGGVVQFPNAFRAATTGVITSIHISLKSTQSGGFKVYLFNAQPVSVFADFATPAIVAADIPKVDSVHTLTAYDNGLGTHTIYTLDGIGKAIDAATTSLFALLVTTSAVTFASTSDVWLCVGVLQD